MAISLKKDNTKSYKSSKEKVTELKRNKIVPLKEKIEIFERFYATGEKITGKTIFEGYPIGKWAIQIRNLINRTQKNKKQEINITEDQLKRLEQMGILERTIKSTIDEKIDALIKWKAKYPKAKIKQHSSNVALEEYAKTEEEYKKLLEEYERMQKYYEYIRIRKAQNKLTKKQYIKCKEGNVGGIFKYPTKVEKLAKKYGVTEKNIDYILINYGTIENFYKLYKRRKLKSQDDVILAGVMVKSVLDLDFNYNKGRYDKLYKAIIKKEYEDPELNLYFSEKLKEELQGLTERERYIIERLFGLMDENLPSTYTDIGKSLGLTSERIREIEKDVLSRLEKNLEKFDFDEQKLRDTLTKDEIKQISNLEEKLDNIRLSNINMNDNEAIRCLSILKSFVYEPERQEVNEDLTGEKNQELDKSPKLEELGFSTRTINALGRKNIKTLNQISNLTYKELSQIRNLGEKAIKEIISKLEEHGLGLKEEPKVDKTKKQNFEAKGFKLASENDQYIDKVNFSNRIINALNKQNIETLSQVSNYTYKELIQIRNLGKKSIGEIISKLEEYGFCLREENNIEIENLEKPRRKESLIKRIIEQQKIISEQQSKINELTNPKKEL